MSIQFFTHTHTHTQLHTHKHTHTHTHTHTHMHTHVRTHLHACLHTHVYIYAHTYTYVCVCVRVYLFIFIFVPRNCFKVITITRKNTRKKPELQHEKRGHIGYSPASMTLCGSPYFTLPIIVIIFRITIWLKLVYGHLSNYQNAIFDN